MQMDALGNHGFGMRNLVPPQAKVTLRSEIPALEPDVWSAQWHMALMGNSTQYSTHGSPAAWRELLQACDQIVLFPSENNALKPHVIFLLRVTIAADGSNVTMGLTTQNLQIMSQKQSHHLLKMLMFSRWGVWPQYSNQCAHEQCTHSSWLGAIRAT